MVPLEEAASLVGEQLERGRSIRDRHIQDRSTLGSAHSDYSTWVEYNRELLRRILSTTEVADDFGRSARMIYTLGPSSLREDLDEFRGDVETHLRRLESILERLPLFEPKRSAADDVKAPQRTEAETRRVFVVHGRNIAALDRVIRLLSDLDLEPVVLRDQPNAGRTIIEKFEAHADVGYAIVLMTGDDVGAVNNAPDIDLHLRARQNVVLELGFFIGRLGRRVVAALVERDVQIPSDIDGVIYIPYDAGDNWRLMLAKEMRAAGLPVDLNRL